MKNALFEMNIPQNTEELPQTKIKWVCKGEVFFSAMIGDDKLEISPHMIPKGEPQLWRLSKDKRKVADFNTITDCMRYADKIFAVEIYN